jgi:hypothetical protein
MLLINNHLSDIIFFWHSICLCVCVHLICNMNVHMKNTNIKYKLNFKTMKKGLLTLLAASLVFVGCQNYDDQFDDLNAQISALKSQVDGLSSLSGQVSSLSGTISGLQAGVSAAQASADAATAAASNIDFSSLTAGLNTLQAEVDQIQASLATAVTAADIAALEADIAAVQVDVTELLEGSGVYSGTLNVTNKALLSAAKALGNGINIISGGLNVTVTSDMDMDDLQGVLDKVFNVTGHVTFTNTLATQTAMDFDKLTSADDVNLKQKGQYNLAALTTASDITLHDTYSDDVSSVDLGALTSVTNINTGSTADAITFDQSTSIDLGALAYYAGGDLSLTTKTGGTLDIASLTDTNTAGTLTPFTLTIAGPASLSISKIKGDAGATTDGTIAVSKVSSFTISDFGGDIDVNAKVATLNVSDAYQLDIAGATDLESLTVEGVKQFGKAYDALSATNKAALGYDSAYMDLDVPAAADDLTTVSLSGQFNVVDLANGLANLSSVTSTATMTSLDMSDTADLSSVNLTGSKINSLTANNTGASSLTLDYTYRATSEATTATSTTYGTLSVANNADLASLTSTVDDIGDLDITGNTKLTALSFANLNSEGTVTNPDVDIYNNNLTAVKSTDTYQSTIASTALHGSTDTGSYDEGTSGMAGLKTYLDAIVTNATTAEVIAMFDKVSTEVVGGASADTTTTPGDFDDTRDYTSASIRASADDASEHWVVLYLYAGTAGTSYDTDVVSEEVRTYIFDVNRNNNILTDVALPASEGFTITYASSQSLTFDGGDTYNADTVNTVDELVAYLDADTSLDAAGIDIDASRNGFEKTYVTINYLVSSGTAVAATASTAGQINFTMGVDETGTTTQLSYTFIAAPTEAALASGIMQAIDGSNLYDASSVTSARSNQFIVQRVVSKSGYSEKDTSPIAINVPDVSITIDNAMSSTTLTLVPSSFDALFDTVSNAGGTTGGSTPVYTLSASSSQKKGIAVRLVNTGSVAFSSAVTLTLAGNNSNTTIVSSAAGANDGMKGLLAEGTNMVASGTVTSSSASTSTKGSYWVAAFTSISDGNPTATGNSAVTCDRTQWLG